MVEPEKKDTCTPRGATLRKYWIEKFGKLMDNNPEFIKEHGFDTFVGTISMKYGFTQRRIREYIHIYEEGKLDGDLNG